MKFTYGCNRDLRIKLHLLGASLVAVLMIVSCSSSQQQGQQSQKDPVGNAQSANSQNGAKHNGNNPNAAASNTNTNFTNDNEQKNSGSKNYTAGINNAVEPATNAPLNTITNTPSNVLAPVNTALNTTTPLNQAPINGVTNLADASTNAVPANAHPTNAAPQNIAAQNQNIAVQAPPGARVIDLGPPNGVIQWVGYNYRKEQHKLDVQIVTEGRPIYKIFQDVNRAKQPEIVIRFLNTEIRHKVRRDLDASEFRSPVAFVRMRRDNVFRHSDVILTLRDKIQPKMVAKGSSIMLTFDIPDRWYGPQGQAAAPIAKVDIAPDANVMPVVDPSSEAQRPTAKTIVPAYVDDPGKDEFKEVSAEQEVPLVPTEKTPELIPAPVPVAQPAVVAAPPAPVAQPAVVAAPVAKPVAAPAAVAAKPAANPVIAKNTANIAPVAQAVHANNATTLVPQNVSPPQAPPAAKPVRHAQLNVSPETEALPQRQPQQMQPQRQPQQRMAPPAFVPQQPVMMAPPPVMMAPPPQQMMAPQVVPIPQGVPGVVPQQNPGQPAAPPADQKDNTGKGADKFEVRTRILETRFSVAGVAQAAPMMDVSPITVEEGGMQPAAEQAAPSGADLQGVDQTAGGSTQTGTPKRVLKFDFRNATVGTVLRAISGESGLNFVMPPEVAAKKMSVSLNNVPWDVALKAVLEANRLGMEEVGPNIIRIDTLRTFVEDRDTQDKAKQATAALVPTKVLVMRLSYALAEKIAPIVQDMFPKSSDSSNVAQMRNYARFKVKADSRSNSLIVEATPMELQKIRALVDRLDMATPQVRISSRIVEVLAKAESGLGISWGSPFNIDGGRGLGFGSLPFPNNMTSNFAVDPSLTGNPVGAVSMRFGSINNVMALDLKIKMLETRSEAESLQSQDLMVEDNQEAKIEAGSVDYFSAPAQGLQGPTLTPVTYSTSLGVTPHITADGAVQMNLKITGDVPTKANAEAAAAGKLSRSLNTTMMRRSGDTAVIGGLYTTDKTKLVNGIPYLSRLPIIGALFRSTYSLDQRRDLLIMVTPTIVNTAAGNIEQDPTAGAPMGPLSAGATGIALPPMRRHGEVDTGDVVTTTTPGKEQNEAKGQGYPPPPENNAAVPVATKQAATQQAAPKQKADPSENVTPVSEEQNIE